MSNVLQKLGNGHFIPDITAGVSSLQCVQDCTKLNPSQRLSKIFTSQDRLLKPPPNISLTDEEQDAVLSYLYDNVNPWLRLTKIIPTEVPILDALIKKMPPLTEDCVVYRAIIDTRFPHVKSYLMNFRPGATLTDSCYASTSCDLNEYAKTHLTSPDSVLLRIVLPKGTRGVYYPQCKEYILPRNNSFKVEKIDGIGYCSYILPE